MKLDTIQKNVDIQSSAEKKIDYGIDTSQMWLLYNILSQYSNPVGSIVRELSTNAVDSHIESNQDKRITVRINEDNKLTGTRAAFEVEDYGTGISPDRLEKIYSKFLGSSKRDSNDEHGAYGLGSKSPFSYTDMFYTVTRYNGYEYFYAMHKGENCPRIELLNKEVTDKPNGTTVNVAIQGGDRYKFLNEVKKQLAYFDNVNHVGTEIDNNYRIIQGEHFIYREHAADLGLDQLHICLGKVYYPLDFSVVDIKSKKSSLGYASHRDRVRTPIGLKFEIGDLPIVWSRENIEYTNDAIRTIEKKYELAQEELQDTYNDLTDSVDTIKDYFIMKRQSKDKELELVDGVSVTAIDHMVDMDLELEPYKELPNYPGIFEALNLVYKVHKSVSNGIAHSTKGSYNKATTRLQIYGAVVDKEGDLRMSGNPYRILGSYSTKQNKYMDQILGESDFLLISKRAESEKPSEGEILTTFGIEEREFKDVDDDLMSLIKKYTLECVKLFRDRAPVYEEIDVPEDYNPTPTNKVRTNMYDPRSDEYNPDLKIHFKVAAMNRDSYGVDMQGFTVFEPTIGWLLEHKSQLRIYGFQDDSDTLEAVANLFYDFTGATYKYSRYEGMTSAREHLILKIAQGKEDALMDLSDQAIHVDEFLSRRHQVLIRELTHYYINTELEDEKGFNLKQVNPHTIRLLKDLGMVDFYNAIEAGRDLANKAAKGLRRLNLNKVPPQLVTLLSSPAFLDKNILDTYNLAIAYLEKYPLLYSIIKEDQPSDQFELLKEELKFYLKGKDKIHPLLIRKLKRKKENEDKDKSEILLSSLNLNHRYT